jgi:putative alpha-1,2-mannosidase
MMRALGFSFMLITASAPAAAAQVPVDLVDRFMGTTGDRGQLSPAAAAPFGMVQLAPDTTTRQSYRL